MERVGGRKIMITEKDNVFNCDCGFSFERGRSGAHSCETGLRKKLAESEAKLAALAAELRAVEAIHNEAVFITDDHYERCPPEVQKIIRSLAVMQIPAYQDFLTEVRAQGVEMFAKEMHADISGDDAREFAAQIRKGVQS
ncbi:hypothetical protein [Enterobacter hormaechei]|uniref:hypothetical protein n=2 Tax=Enterobacter hormaechei TaxID=158836 RepID=UPI00159E71A6|nr:hypothetical protein [Enterobacter hormaechei]